MEEELKKLIQKDIEISKANNQLLGYIISILRKEESEDFINNIMANVIGNRID